MEESAAPAGTPGVPPALSHDEVVAENAGETPAVPGTPTVTHKLWHSRGYLPHFDQGAVVQFITFRLADSLPKDVLAALPDAEQARRKRVEEAIDESHGACFLRDPSVAAIVRDALLHFDGKRYRLIAWVIMPNHVHALIEQHKGFGLGDIIHSWKSFTAKRANKALGREGAFWAPDYFDRYIRDDGHFFTVIRYIHQNPVKAGLIERAEDWQFGSARAAAGTSSVPGTADVPPACNTSAV